MLVKYGDGDCLARDLRVAQQERDAVAAQRETVIEEYRQYREKCSREAAAQRETWENKFAAMTDRAFKLADPEVHAYVLHCVFHSSGSASLKA